MRGWGRLGYGKNKREEDLQSSGRWVGTVPALDKQMLLRSSCHLEIEAQSERLFFDIFREKPEIQVFKIWRFIPILRKHRTGQTKLCQ